MRPPVVLVALVMLPCLGGCAAADRPAVERALTRFSVAYQERDGARACSLLASATRRAVAQSSRSPCPAGLLSQRLPRLRRITAVEVYGDQAEVRTVADTVFLARFRDGWKVVAAGCMRRPGRPYDCELEAG